MECHKLHPLIAFDTEYPGITYRTFLSSSDDDCYHAMKANVESSKLIQCGFTLFNAKGEIGGNEGVDMFKYGFFPKLLSALYSHKYVEFVTFQGAYDFAYVLCILNNGKLPETREKFASEVVRVFGEVYDLKVMAGFCDGLGEHLGLSKLAHLLNIPRVGRAHHAGSDSLMTALVFIKLRQVFEDSRFAKGMLYGIGKRMMVTATTTTNTTMPSSAASMPMMCQQNLVSYPSSDMPFHNGYIPSYDHNQVLFWNHSAVPWMSYDNGMYVNQLNHVPSSTFSYPYQTPYAADYIGQLPDLLQ
ncbi:hypothetical protein Bca52824_079533 [Brassica carinata]|uniref:poly(A)-specific ribonuclease n=1 Tax=Brassica carinata TaxID=52824 RepID=A0A8X7PXL7_BRACI|nr:hypothetical protein Bca52824_079533 [Brassica carinata]